MDDYSLCYMVHCIVCSENKETFQSTDDSVGTFSFCFELSVIYCIVQLKSRDKDTVNIYGASLNEMGKLIMFVVYLIKLIALFGQK